MTDMNQILIALCSPMMVTVLCPTNPMRGCIDKSSGVNENVSPQPASQLGASSNEFGRNGSDLFSKLNVKAKDPDSYGHSGELHHKWVSFRANPCEEMLR